MFDTMGKAATKLARAGRRPGRPYCFRNSATGSYYHTIFVRDTPAYVVNCQGDTCPCLRSVDGSCPCGGIPGYRNQQFANNIMASHEYLVVTDVNGAYPVTGCSF